ncbi:MAG: hypothetical protein PVI03_02085 [Candidatus Thorarchaeota archaeon]|jgi:hypothetical protein
MEDIEDIWEAVQYEEFCNVHPMTYNDWIRLTLDWIEGIADVNPYPLDEKSANKKIMERLH